MKKELELNQHDLELFDLHQKNSSKLTLTGGQTNTWFWRDEELSYANFVKLDINEKKQYLKFLLELPVEEYSTNDEYILHQYGPTEYTNMDKFFSMDEITATLQTILKQNKEDEITDEERLQFQEERNNIKLELIDDLKDISGVDKLISTDSWDAIYSNHRDLFTKYYNKIIRYQALKKY